jgi:thiol-disulfide isomerase/thioredoxin
MLVACGNGTTAQHDSGRRVSSTVADKELAELKSQTDVPDCPRVPSQPVAGGMPSVTVPCLGGGRSVDVAGLRGPMIVNFWASWCGDCRTEMPALASYARAHPGVKIIGVDYADPQAGPALQLAQRSHVAYPLVVDLDQDLSHQGPLPAINGLPFNAFIDATGKVVHLKFGAMLSEADVAQAAHDYLGVGG